MGFSSFLQQFTRSKFIVAELHTLAQRALTRSSFVIEHRRKNAWLNGCNEPNCFRVANFYRHPRDQLLKLMPVQPALEATPAID